MKNLIILSMLGIGLLISGCSEDLVFSEDPIESKSAKKMAPALVGICDAMFTYTPPTFWNGTIDFADDGKYNITFISLGDGPRDFSQASPFKEELFIYDFNATWPPEESEIYLKASTSGVVMYANKIPEPSKFLENGKVTYAFGPLAMWANCSIHIRGYVNWEESGLPEGAISTFRIN